MLLAVLLCTAGCGTATDAPAAAPGPVQGPDSASSALAAPQPRPNRVTLAGRAIDGPIMVDGLGLDAQGGHAEPPVEEPKVASWYNLGPRPGEVGPAVVLGHVNGSGQQGIFANLHNVRDGDRVTITREDGSEIEFEVYRTLTIDKEEFPADEVYGNTDGPEIRLVTCGGNLDRVHHRYLSNIIVFGRLIQT